MLSVFLTRATVTEVAYRLTEPSSDFLQSLLPGHPENQISRQSKHAPIHQDSTHSQFSALTSNRYHARHGWDTARERIMKPRDFVFANTVTSEQLGMAASAEKHRPHLAACTFNDDWTFQATAFDNFIGLCAGAD